jgi:hypothetical protein
MTKASLIEIVKALNDAAARYLVVGGIAVNAHGFMRLTVDVDLFIHLDSQNLLHALQALGRLGYRPAIPVSFEDIADRAKRDRWIVEKHMVALKLFSDFHRETAIDVFVNEPINFEDAFQRVHYYPLDADVKVPVCSYQDLVKLKLLAKRPKDLFDLDQLKKLRGEP